MVTSIGNTAWSSYICDASTPAASTYCLYLAPGTMTMVQPMTADIALDSAAGTSTHNQSFNIGHAWQIRNLKLTTQTDIQNFQKAKYYWNEGAYKLYINIQTDGLAFNIAQNGTYTTPTTLTATRVKLFNFREVPMPSSYNISFDARYVS